LLNHFVFLKYHPDTPPEHIDAFCKKMLALKELIIEIQSLEIGLDEFHEERSWDVVVMIRTQSVEALKIYQKHPEHLAVMKFNEPYVINIGSTDFHNTLS